MSKYRDFENILEDIIGTDEKRVDEFLDTILEEYAKDGNEKALLLGLKTVVKLKKGFTKLAKETGLSRETLYKTLSINGNPKLSTLNLILRSLDYTFKFKHI